MIVHDQREEIAGTEPAQRFDGRLPSFLYFAAGHGAGAVEHQRQINRRPDRFPWDHRDVEGNLDHDRLGRSGRQNFLVESQVAADQRTIRRICGKPQTQQGKNQKNPE